MAYVLFGWVCLLAMAQAAVRLSFNQQRANAACDWVE
jgi:hypothetical protein